MHKDITEVFAGLYFRGNKERALKVLDAQQEITQEQLLSLSLFSGFSISNILQIFLFFVLVSRNFRGAYHRHWIDEFFQLDPLNRLLFTFIYFSFAAGLLIRVWKQHDINYIHILQVDYRDRLNPF